MVAENKKTKKLPVIFIVIGLLLVVGIVAGFVFQDKIKTFTTDITANIENSGKPRFVFDTAQFPDWASHGNSWHNHDDTEGPVVTIGATQCVEGSNCSNLVEKCRTSEQCEDLERYTADGCFVHAYYFSYTIDPDTAVADELKRWSGFGTDPEEVGVRTLSMSTPEGNKEYQFYQYDTNSDDDSYKQGSAFGFVPLSDGHVEIRSVCWEASQLDETLPVLGAIRLEV